MALRDFSALVERRPDRLDPDLAVLSGLVGRTRRGRRLLERVGERATERELARGFGDRSSARIGALLSP